jgi:hypothetical protein
MDYPAAKLKEFVMKLKSLVLSLALVLVLSGSALAAEATVHFFVVPASLPAERLNAFNDFLAKTAGGFTTSRSMGVSMSAQGKKISSENLSYTVSAPKNVAKEIKVYLKEKCGQNDVFMLIWKAERVE